MATFLINYDIKEEGAAYSRSNKKLTDRIKELFGTWCHELDSTWIVVTEMTAAEIRDDLRRQLDFNDKLLVVKSGREAAWHGFDEKTTAWLKKHL